MMGIFFRCIYMQNDTAFELEVEIVKDYNDVKSDIQEVLSVVERGDSFENVVQNVSFIDFNDDVMSQKSSCSLMRVETNY